MDLCRITVVIMHILLNMSVKFSKRKQWVVPFNWPTMFLDNDIFFFIAVKNPSCCFPCSAFTQALNLTTSGVLADLIYFVLMWSLSLFIIH